MSILVTGGAGYIGSHTCVELLKAGYDIVVLDNFLNSTPERLSRVKMITGRDFKTCLVDLLDVEKVDEVFAAHDIEAVFHFAGLKEISKSPNTPLSYYYNNITGTIFLCELMKKHNVKKLIFSSSAIVYQMNEPGPITEDAPLWTFNPYGRTILMIEELLRDLYLSDPSWSIEILRYFTPFGAHESGLICEQNSRFSGFDMSDIFQTLLLKKLKELNIDDNENLPGDGIFPRDFIHVSDLAAGHLMAFEHAIQSTGLDVFNLGTGKSCNKHEMLKAFEKAAGIKLPFQFDISDEREEAACFVDPAKANKVLGWSAKNGPQEMADDWWHSLMKNTDGENESVKGNIDQFQRR